MNALAQGISIVFGIVLAPAVAYVLWRWLDALLDLVPVIRDWRDFRGLDLGRGDLRHRIRMFAWVHRPEPTRTLASPLRVIDAEPTAEPGRPRPRQRALPVGASTDNSTPAAEVA